MKEKLIQYIDLLFAGTPDAEDIKQEILQNTLDRYDDLIAQGKSPESAYSLAISGIGDIHEILEQKDSALIQQAVPTTKQEPQTAKSSIDKRLLRAAAIACFILCPGPVIILESALGVCLLLAMVAAGVGLLVFCGKDEVSAAVQEDTRSPLHKTLHGIAWGAGLCLYFLISFLTGAWYITWLIFPIIACTCSLINACFDLNKVFLNAVIRIVIFAVLILILTVSLLGGYLGSNVLSFIDEHYTQVDGIAESAGSVSPKQVKDIDIQWVSGSITIQTGNVQDIQFYEDGGLSADDKMVWNHDGDRLTIQFCKPQFQISLFGNINVPSKNLVITVPQDWLCDELGIDSVSAEINISQLYARDADIVNVSGLCRIYDCTVVDMDIETISGSVIFDGEATSMNLTSVSANCTAQLTNRPNEIDLETVSGDLALILPADCGFTVSLDSVSGNLISDFATTTKNNHYIYGDGVSEISADTVSGDILIKMPE